MNSYYTHLNINYDSKLLIEESKIATYKPFESGYKNNTFFSYAPTWLQGRITNFDNFPEIKKITEYIAYKINSSDVRPRFYKQEANTAVPMHRDQNTKCCVNIVLSEKAAPITYEDIGDIDYKCALLNIRQSHEVKEYPEERLLLKFSIFDVDYEDAVKRWNTPVIKIDEGVDIERILLETSSYVSYSGQICLQGVKGNLDPYLGIGQSGGSNSWERLQTHTYKSEEFNQNIFNMEYTNSILEKYSMVHTRLMDVKPKSCYSYHVDIRKRLHIPLETNDHCWFIIDKVLHHLPADGSVYLVDTMLPHTVLNCGSEIRTHIVSQAIINPNLFNLS
jgi:hypothetical protein